MELEQPEDIATDIQAQQILLASAQHNLEALRTLLRTGSSSVQDPETGFTPLHAAIAACENFSTPRHNGAESNGTAINGHSHAVSGDEQADTEDADVEAAAKTMRLLLQNGAIWNDLDANNETPGCLARKLGLSKLYDIMVNAGVRAEMLLNRLDEYELLRDKDEDEEEDEGAGQGREGEGGMVFGSEMQNDQIRASEATPVEDIQPDAPPNPSAAGPTNPDYLRSSLTFQPSRVLDSAQNGVMMSWETPIMERTADLLCPRPGLRVLNIGHGMGIIDNFFQSKDPSIHHIIEAHPSVLEHMRASGWEEKPGVTIHEGTWQSVLPKIIEQEILFDAIYFDTFAEDYKALRDFFSDFLIGILDESGKWGFFNGLGADRQVCYDVYCKVVEMDLFEAGYDTTWETLEVKDMGKEEWEGVKRRYWLLEEYKLPICEFVG
jgi:protein arginine N-methyltransferase 2